MNILNVFQNIIWWKLLLEFYFIFIIVLLVLRLAFSNSRLLNFTIIFLFLFGLKELSYHLDLSSSYNIFDLIVRWYPFVIIVIMGPDLRRMIEMFWRKDSKENTITMGNEESRREIVEAVFHLAERKMGALITIEKHNTLDHFADRAIMMHSNISKELLINIFIPNTPLHDGAVIIRGDEILCAGAYFILSEREVSDKTMGSRHRAALGISEISDGLTIIVSEETGNVSIALEGILLRMNDPDKLMEYLSMFMR